MKSASRCVNRYLMQVSESSGWQQIKRCGQGWTERAKSGESVVMYWESGSLSTLHMVHAEWASACLRRVGGCMMYAEIDRRQQRMKRGCHKLAATTSNTHTSRAQKNEQERKGSLPRHARLAWGMQ